MPDVYIEDVIAPNYDELLYDVLDHRHSQYLLKAHVAEFGNIKRMRRTAALALFTQLVDKTVDVAFTASAAHVQPPV